MFRVTTLLAVAICLTVARAGFLEDIARGVEGTVHGIRDQVVKTAQGVHGAVHNTLGVPNWHGGGHHGEDCGHGGHGGHGGHAGGWQQGGQQVGWQQGGHQGGWQQGGHHGGHQGGWQQGGQQGGWQQGGQGGYGQGGGWGGRPGGGWQQQGQGGWQQQGQGGWQQQGQGGWQQQGQGGRPQQGQGGGNYGNNYQPNQNKPLTPDNTISKGDPSIKPVDPIVKPDQNQIKPIPDTKPPTEEEGNFELDVRFGNPDESGDKNSTSEVSKVRSARSVPRIEGKQIVRLPRCRSGERFDSNASKCRKVVTRD